MSKSIQIYSMFNVHFLCYFAAFAASSLFFVLLTVRQARLQSLSTLTAIASIIIWSVIHLAPSFGAEIKDPGLQLADLIRNGGLFVILMSAIAPLIKKESIRFSWYRTIGITLFATVIFSIFPLAFPENRIALFLSNTARLSAYSWLVQTIIGLLLVEQVFRNYPHAQRWAIKHLCLGIGSIFAYDLFFYSDAILMQRIDFHLSDARGLITALAIPLIGISLARNPRFSLDIQLSRSVVFHSATLLGSGIYLTAMALAGYYVRSFSGAWGATLQIGFLFTAGLFLLTLLFSSHVRARIRILLSEHFFTFKYDYRTEWRSFTDSLAKTEMNTPEVIILALGGIVKSPGGLLWVRQKGYFECVGNINVRLPALPIITENDSLVEFIQESRWIIDLVEMRSQPDAYPEIDAPAWTLDEPALWLVIPLFFRTELIGFALLTKSSVVPRVNWEDRGLLKTAGLQAAGILAHHLADQALIRARQFEAFNQLAAYVAHDLKNLIAQQSLIVANAERHRDNPEFFLDVIRTIQNSVERMERLMVQLRRGTREKEPTQCSLPAVLADVIARLGSASPTPVVQIGEQDLVVVADRERLITALGHLLKNAQEATSDDGSIQVEVVSDSQTAVIRISDDGAGMSEEFIANRLFKPFDSTKGLTGMGIGAFEAREFFQGMGGRLDVSSQIGVGTQFTIRIPCLGPKN